MFVAGSFYAPSTLSVHDPRRVRNESPFPMAADVWRGGNHRSQDESPLKIDEIIDALNSKGHVPEIYGYPGRCLAGLSACARFCSAMGECHEIPGFRSDPCRDLGRLPARGHGKGDLFVKAVLH